MYTIFCIVGWQAPSHLKIAPHAGRGGRQPQWVASAFAGYPPALGRRGGLVSARRTACASLARRRQRRRATRPHSWRSARCGVWVSANPRATTSTYPPSRRHRSRQRTSPVTPPAWVGGSPTFGEVTSSLVRAHRRQNRGRYTPADTPRTPSPGPRRGSRQLAANGGRHFLIVAPGGKSWSPQLAEVLPKFPWSRALQIPEPCVKFPVLGSQFP